MKVSYRQKYSGFEIKVEDADTTIEEDVSELVAKPNGQKHWEIPKDTINEFMTVTVDMCDYNEMSGKDIVKFVMQDYVTVTKDELLELIDELF